VFRSRPVSLALVGLFVWVTGCSTHTQIGIDEIADHGKVRVTLIDGERETIHDPWVEGDSIRSEDAEAIPLGHVTGVDAVGTNEVGTVLVVGAGIFLVVMIIACAVEGCGPDFD
jgi:hypothetical protein